MGIRALLVWPNSHNEVLGWGDLGAVAEPLALEYLGAALQQAGHAVQILDLRLHPDAFSKTIADYQPQLIGVTAFSMHVRRALEICRAVKTANPSTKTIMGGHHATFLPEDFFQPEVDYVVAGDGVRAIVAVADALDCGEIVHPSPGLHLRDRAGSFTAPAGAVNFTMAEEISGSPLPERRLTVADRHRYFIDWMKPVALLRTTVGCPYRCNFCSIWRALDGRYYVRDDASVVDELAGIDEKFVFLIDDEAFINPKRMMRLADAINRANIRDKEFFTYCRIDTLVRSRDAIARWRNIGLRRLFIGIDAISTKDLEEYNKKCTIAQIEEGLNVARELDISVFAQFIVNTDFDRGDFKALVRFIERNRIDYPSFTVLTPLPGTDMLRSFDHVVERQANGRPNWELFDCQNAVTATRLSKPDFRREYRDLYHVFKGTYTPYREHNVLVQEKVASVDNLSLPVSQAISFPGACARDSVVT